MELHSRLQVYVILSNQGLQWQVSFTKQGLSAPHTLQGYTVVGVEGVLYIVEDFFKENSLEHEKVPVPAVNGWKFSVSVPCSYVEINDLIYCKTILLFCTLRLICNVRLYSILERKFVKTHHNNSNVADPASLPSFLPSKLLYCEGQNKISNFCSFGSF